MLASAQKLAVIQLDRFFLRAVVTATAVSSPSLCSCSDGSRLRCGSLRRGLWTAAMGFGRDKGLSSLRRSYASGSSASVSLMVVRAASSMSWLSGEISVLTIGCGEAESGSSTKCHVALKTRSHSPQRTSPACCSNCTLATSNKVAHAGQQHISTSGSVMLVKRVSCGLPAVPTPVGKVCQTRRYHGSVPLPVPSGVESHQKASACRQLRCNA